MLERRQFGCALLLLLGAVSAGCGTSGSRATSAIEVIYFVNAPEGTPFQVQESPEPRACGSAGAGLQAANADHRFGDRVFRAPYFFVQENAHQPVRAVFVNVDDSNNPSPISVDLFFGTNLQRTLPQIPPGDCAAIGTDEVDPIDPVVPGDEVRMEICAFPAGADTTPSCDDPDFVDARASFFASLGDLKQSHVTNCNILPVAETCRTPATFFLEDAKEEVSAVFTKLNTQNPDVTIKVELYINGRLRDSDASKNTAIVQEPL